MVGSYLLATRHHGGLVSRSIVIATVKALIKRNPQFNLDHVAFGNSWAKSLVFRMGYVRRKKTTSKVQIPEAVQKEVELIFQRKIAKIVEAHQIPNCMILNLDQTPSKFVLSSNTTLAPRGQRQFLLLEYQIREPLQQRLQSVMMVISYQCSWSTKELLFKAYLVLIFQIHSHKAWIQNISVTLPKFLK